MAKLDKGAVEDCLYDFGVLIWRNELYIPLEDLDKFFEERGTTRQEVAAAAKEYGIIFTSATLEGLAEPEEVQRGHPFIRFMKWLWK